MLKFFKSDEFCLLSPAARTQKLVAFGLKPRIKLKKASIFDGLLVSKAYAATNKHPFITVGFNVTLADMGGVTYDVYYATDFSGYNAVHMAVGPVLTSEQMSAGAAITFGLFPAITKGDLEGWGASIGFAADLRPGTPLSGGFDFLFDGKLKALQGIGFSIGGGVSKSDVPGSISVTYSKDWKL